MAIHPPPGLDERSQALWESTLTELRERGLWHDALRSLLESYVRNVEDVRKARERIPSDYLTRGEDGEVFEHPAVVTAREAERSAAAFATSLLLTPAARAGVSVDFAWQEPDDDD